MIGIETIPLLLGLLAAGGVVLLTGGYMRRAAWRIGMLDSPKLRGVHGDTVARSGGLTIAAGLLAALLVQMLASQALSVRGYLDEINHVYLLLPALVILAMGALDDIKGVGALAKLAVQSLAGLWAWALGFSFDSFTLFGLPEVDTGLFSLPLTVLFVVALTNAFNLIDGIDGLCAGAAFIGLAGIAALGTLGGNAEVALALPLGVAALAFMRWNLGKPRAFLGDSGSTFLGFLTAALALKAVRTTDGALDLVPLFLLLSLPIVDVTVVFFRRIVQGRSPLRPDRGHIHHIALWIFDGGSRRAAATLLAMAGIAASASLLARMEPMYSAAALALPLGLYAGVYYLGGYLSPRNLMAAGPATDIAEVLSQAGSSDPMTALNDPKALRLLALLRLSSLALYDADGSRCWQLGAHHENARALDVPLYAGGRVKCGWLALESNHATRSGLAFAAHLLLPLFPVFMDALQLIEPARNMAPSRRTRRIAERSKRSDAQSL
ncbi:putative undecaprenyl-phosphate N-acetylglucosaminyl 1-phosphate transferase [Planctomycetaceae bacterium]|nr:putative undecaprenyl-phosphate N-acetylglucosaminyl 1-phosphate transferase [Planctomycetaceae bacterium]